MLWHFVFLGLFSHTHKYFHFLHRKLKEVVMCCIQSKVVRVNQISTPLSPRETQRVSHLIFPPTFCIIQKKGNSGNDQKKTLFFFKRCSPRVVDWEYQMQNYWCMVYSKSVSTWSWQVTMSNWLFCWIKIS